MNPALKAYLELEKKLNEVVEEHEELLIPLIDQLDGLWVSLSDEDREWLNRRVI